MPARPIPLQAPVAVRAARRVADVLRLAYLRMRLRWVEDDIKHYTAEPYAAPAQLAVFRQYAQQLRVAITLLEHQ